MREDRFALAAQVLALRDEEGLTHKEIASRLGISPKKSSNLATDPDGSKLRERHLRAGGVCVDCGARTSAAGERCLKCERIRVTEDKKWTRESVIDAIQRFAVIHGRPPIADEWIKSDQVNGYPARTTVYKSRGRKSPYGIFPKWADAIEAAGFDRPTTGRRTAMAKRHGYVILRERDDGLWELMDTRDEHSQIIALNSALNGQNPEEGRWVAVPGRYWEPRLLKPKTIYEFASDTGDDK
jgi:ribosomal protein L40E